MKKSTPQTPMKAFRCAVYTRKSTEDGLEQEYNSLDAQRDSGEAYIKSQQGEGWVCLPNRYDDGGFTGANMERPALRRLLDDIEAGKVDCVVVYKVDRLSRSLLDFARIMESFDRHKVAFVSVTQAFNTGSSMGRLVLNVLLSFAQFEREMISERTRDKIAAARRKGKWSGGMPLLGYTVENSKLIVDELEAARVREIFEMYLDHQSVLTVSQELNKRNWCTKLWTTKKGIKRGGRAFDKSAVYQLLTNVVYAGKVAYKTEVHPGEHKAIIDPEIFEKVQIMLARNGRTGGQAVRNKHNALLRGRLRCEACGCGMSHSYTKKGSKLYRYYICHRAQKSGWHLCPSPSLPAAEIERFVIEQIKCIGRDPALIRDTLAQVRSQTELAQDRLTTESSSLERDLRREHAELRQLSTTAPNCADPLAQCHDRIQQAERRKTEIEDELVRLRSESIAETDVIDLLQDFDRLWSSLAPREQSRVIELLIEQVSYNGNASKLSISYHPTGIRILVNEFAGRLEAVA